MSEVRYLYHKIDGTKYIWDEYLARHEMIVTEEEWNRIQEGKVAEEVVVERISATPEASDIVQLTTDEDEEEIIAPSAPEDKKELAKQYEEKFGKKPFAGWAVDVLKAKLAE